MMEGQIDPTLNTKKKAAWQIGFAVFLLLLALTIGEFFVGTVAVTWWFILMGIAVLKAFFVVRDYMHLPRLFKGDEEEH
jgi:hypothetical protein